jgi:chemotaxis protein methyltransferase WspC
MRAANNIEGLLKQAIGLHAASIGSSAVERAVQARQSACELADRQDYWELVRASAAELQALIEVVVVPETWFFRDCEAFAELGRIALHDWLPIHPRGILQLLSLPCSTGEEPYSMAMTLLEAGFPLDRCRIDAVDISARSLTHARRAIYGRNSFRGDDLKFRDRHFEDTAHGRRLNDALREPVHFQQGNLFADDFLPGAEPYDLIFCRNLLIYFDPATQTRAVEVLQRLLSADGVLFVGPAEASLLLNQNFASAKVPLAFAFRKTPVVPAAAGPVRPIARREMARPKVAARALVRKPQPTKRAPPRPKPDSHRIEPCIDKAFALANQGRLTEAAQSCEEFMRKDGPSAQAFYLMGLISTADGRLSEADRYYRKALYLDRNHYDSLVHLALLLEKQGDAEGAKLLRDRVERL